MKSAPTMLVRAIEECIVFVHGATAPSDAEWDRVVEIFRTVGPSRARVLVWTDGAAPNAKQRAKLLEVCGESKPKIAVLTASAIARAAGTAISWFNPAMRLFAPDAIDQAIAHLQVSDDRRTSLRRALDELRAEMATPQDPARRAK